MSDTLILRSSISTPLMRKTLWRGTLLALMGAVSIIAGGAFISPQALGIWGLPLFLFGIGMITFGLLPYRNLKKLEMFPYEIEIDETSLLLRKKNTPLISIQIATIATVKYIETGNTYGIEINFRDSLPLHITYFNSEGRHLLSKLFSQQKRTLLIPYFSKRACDSLIGLEL